MVPEFLKNALELLAPPRCHGCGAALWATGKTFLCPECAAKTAWIGAGACHKCGLPAGKFAAWGASGCLRCQKRPLNLDGVAAVARYRGAIRSMVRSLKFHSEHQLVPVIAEWMTRRWQEAALSETVDVVAPVALHPKRLRTRGFDQSALLAEAIAEKLGVQFRRDALRRTKPTKPQARLRRSERLTAMEGVFEASPEQVRDRAILLVDDVFTTGSTMSAAAAACKKSGAKAVYGIAFAR